MRSAMLASSFRACEELLCPPPREQRFALAPEPGASYQTSSGGGKGVGPRKVMRMHEEDNET